MRSRLRAVRKILGAGGRPEQHTASEQSLVEVSEAVDEENLEHGREAQRIALQNVAQLWDQGETDSAFDLMRRLRLENGPSPAIQFEYGRRALEHGHTWAGREALHDAVELDPMHLDALELFLEANRQSPAVQGAATRAISNVARLLPQASGFDLEAATLLLPSMSTVEIVDQKIRMLRYSEDPVAKNVGRLAPLSSLEWGPLAESEASQELKARLVILLMRSEYGGAYDLLKEASSEAIPQRALRLAARKELRNRQYPEARTLLQHYMRLAPDDSWARVEWEKVAHIKNYLSNRQLTTGGFPFPETSSKAKYTPDSKRVLYLLHSALPHHSMGYATRSHGLLRGIREHGWEVEGVTRLGYPYDMPNMETLGPIEPSVKIDGVPYRRLSTTNVTEAKSPIQSYISRYVDALKSHATEERPFVLHAASNHWNGLAGVSAARELGIPSIYEVRGLWEVTRGSRNPGWMGGPMFNFMARMETDAAHNADQVITITNALRDELINRGIDGGKIVVVPNGVEASRFVARPKNEVLAARFGLQGKAVIGYVGSILNYEGIGLLLDAAHLLKEERDDLAFLFVGDGAELAEYRERVETENLSDIVTFTGRVPHHEVEDYYSLIDICPFPRLPLPVCEMVSPLKPFEAMAMEKTVIASNVRALAEIVTDGETGLLFEKGDSQSLAQALRRLLNDAELQARLATSGRRWVEQEREWRKLAGQIDEIYISLGGSK